jgi:hypothetical protein
MNPELEKRYNRKFEEIFEKLNELEDRLIELETK